GDALHAWIEDLAPPLGDRRPAGELRREALDAAVVEWEDQVLASFRDPELLELLQLVRHLLRKVVGLAVVLGAVVELPDVLVEGDRLRADGELPRRAVLR